MKYLIQRTDKASDQLYSLILYIADDSGSVDLALNYLDRLEAAIMRLADFPYSGTEPRYSTLRKQGFRVLIFEKQLIFHKVDDTAHIVTVHAVVDGRAEYLNLI